MKEKWLFASSEKMSFWPNNNIEEPESIREKIILKVFKTSSKKRDYWFSIPKIFAFKVRYKRIKVHYENHLGSFEKLVIAGGLLYPVLAIAGFDYI